MTSATQATRDSLQPYRTPIFLSDGIAADNSGAFFLVRKASFTMKDGELSRVQASCLFRAAQTLTPESAAVPAQWVELAI